MYPGTNSVAPKDNEGSNKWRTWVDDQAKNGNGDDIKKSASEVLSGMDKLDESLKKYSENPQMTEAFEEVITDISKLKEQVVRLDQVTGNLNSEASVALSELEDTLSALTGLGKGQVQTMALDKTALVEKLKQEARQDIEERSSPRMGG